MRTRLLNLFLVALLALAGMRLSASLREPPPPLPAAAPQEGAAGDGEAEPGGGEPAAGGPGAPGAPPSEGYDVIVARDLFSAARGVVPPAPPPAAKPAAKPVPQPKLTLAGVVILDGEKSAYLLEGPAEARPKKVREGEAFAGGTVKAIRPDGITFLFGGAEVAVPLRTPKDTGPAPRVAGPPAGVPSPGVVQRRVPQPGVAPDPSGRPQRPGRQFPPSQVQPPDAGGEGEEILPEDEVFQEEEIDEFDEGDLGDEEFDVLEDQGE